MIPDVDRRRTAFVLSGTSSQVVVVANFSDFRTDTSVPDAEYACQLAGDARRDALA